MNGGQAGNLDADIARLNTLLSRDNLNANEETDLSELLARLESADGVAKGVEDRLDDILGTLDSLLTTLENKHKGNSCQPGDSSTSPSHRPGVEVTSESKPS
ncbi:hypothetical protein BV22DRAFT_1032006 [Leucogyrophana mollusca]|uniref:Uncharacterized protein n=1 Tax=Leucogyrophana mollusca TaxID=85980 RepID=A0ACB8BNG0_9AGAM|nr:hypothetical protein BV22DRAFT_1032006 [Leucogyrophana mollusca]